MNLVIFQYISGILLVAGIWLAYKAYTYYVKDKEKIAATYLGGAIALLVASDVVYFNFANSENRILMEELENDTAFERKVDMPEKKVDGFNYKKDFNETSTSIEEEAADIHKEIE